MDFDNDFTVSAPLPTVWQFLLDAQQVAPCVPGAQITEVVDATHFRGTVKVKLGAVQITYRGEVAMEADPDQHVIVLRGKGREARGSGGASGVGTTRLTVADNGGTHVAIHSQVDVSGRVAQFGRSIMQDVSNHLIADFASCLEAKLQSQTEEPREPEMNDSSADETDSPSTSSGPPPSPAPAAASPPALPAVTAPRRPALAAAELKLHKILLDVARSRTAALLRFFAGKLDPPR